MTDPTTPTPEGFVPLSTHQALQEKHRDAVILLGELSHMIYRFISPHTASIHLPILDAVYAK